jgi:hypothetical protein
MCQIRKSDTDSENGNALYYIEVRLLSWERMLKRVYDLKLGINIFLDMEE